jgi:hypothetical protein
MHDRARFAREYAVLWSNVSRYLLCLRSRLEGIRRSADQSAVPRVPRGPAMVRLRRLVPSRPRGAAHRGPGTGVMVNP